MKEEDLQPDLNPEEEILHRLKGHKIRRHLDIDSTPWCYTCFEKARHAVLLAEPMLGYFTTAEGGEGK